METQHADLLNRNGLTADLPVTNGTSEDVNVGVSHAGTSSRDAALDVLRGWFIVAMCASHIGSQTYFNKLTHLPRFFSAAEGFVLLSGIVLGMVYGPNRGKEAIVRAANRLLPRAFGLWMTQILLVVAVVAIQDRVDGMSFIRSSSELGGWPNALIQISALQYQPPLINILPLYIVLLCLGPIVIWMLHRRLHAWLLAISVTLYSAAQFFPSFLALQNSSMVEETFRLPAWQALFAIGLCLGFYRERIRDLYSNSPANRRILMVCGVYFAAVFVLAQMQRTPYNSLHLLDSAALERWFDRPELRPGRLLYILSAIVIAYPVVQWAIRRGFIVPIFAFLQRLGQFSLYCFILQTVVALVLNGFEIATWPMWVQEVATIGSIIGIYYSTFLVKLNRQRLHVSTTTNSAARCAVRIS